ncbi:hypothetical protein N8612_08075, partial [Verrucomicrobia bacterium]|nr:hypothetical protein [Verrucomicrobiota bacterium]
MEWVPPILHPEFVVRSRDCATYYFRLVTALVSFALALGFRMLGGGVIGGEFFRICLALVSTLILALSLGVLISACSFHAGRSLLGSGGILLSWILGSIIALNSFGAAMPSPWTLLAEAFDAEYQ